jgi:iron(III) transport system ATP-binding protein
MTTSRMTTSRMTTSRMTTSRMTPTRMTSVTVRNLTKSFDAAPVLRGIDLTVPENSVTAILGPSGCGKTTLLRLIAGFEAPDSGEILLREQLVCGDGHFVAPQHRRVGYVPQEGALFPHLDVADNISFGLRGRERRDGRRVEELLSLVGLEPVVRQRFPHQLSGGQQQRVALARALAPRPSLILLDEPFSSLDAALREGTGRAVLEALTATHTTALLVTHDQSEALSLADQVAVMRDGTLAQVGTPHEVYRAPADLGVAEFVGAAVVVDADVVDGSASSDLGPLNVMPGFDGGRARLLVRPEQIDLVGSTQPGVEARVVDVSYFGHDAALHLEILTSGRLVTARVSGTSVPVPDTLVRVSVTGPVAAYSPEV